MSFNTIVLRIKRLEIQGASSIAREGIKAFSSHIQRCSSKKDIKKCMEAARKKLIEARSTEPMLFNAINYIIRNSSTKADVKHYAEAFLKMKEESEEKIAEYGAELIKKGMTVFTHCHSSHVYRIMEKAVKSGKRFSVVCFETRPRFQGRITASKLVALGIPTTLTIDSAMTESFEKFKPNLVLVGCDAITKSFFINKIGTDTLANMCKKHGVDIYVAGETFKFMQDVKIEERSPDEVWDKRPKKLKIWNPAFDTTSVDLIKGFITEQGIKKVVTCSAL